MDKNKSIFKIEGLPKILWLNLENDTHRREYMESQFEYWGIKNHERIQGYDGRDDDVSTYLKGRIPDNMSQNEVGCVMSHIKAIKHFYENTDDDYVLIMEDDVSFETVKSWAFTWSEFFNLIPYDWDCVQLTTICTGNIHVRLHHRFVNDFSAAVYLITRHHAEKIIKNHIRDKKYKLDNGVKPRPVSEDLIFESGKSYCIPLFLYNLEMGSAIHPEHIDIFHRQSHDGLLNFWQQNGANLDIGSLMDYDPYFLRVSEPHREDPQQPQE
jgi:GR25 family glycosyltransferase involved in LPS biosynthesis